MKVISDTTLVTRSDEGRVDHLPGDSVDLPAEDAKGLIARGLARPAEPPEDSKPAPKKKVAKKAASKKAGATPEE